MPIGLDVRSVDADANDGVNCCYYCCYYCWVVVCGREQMQMMEMCCCSMRIYRVWVSCFPCYCCAVAAAWVTR